MLLNSAVSRNIQLSMDDPNVESHKGGHLSLGEQV